MAALVLSSLLLCFMLQEMTKRVLYCPNLTVSKLAVLVPPPRPQKPVHLPIAELIKVSLQGASLPWRVLSCWALCLLACAWATRRQTAFHVLMPACVWVCCDGKMPSTVECKSAFHGLVCRTSMTNSSEPAHKRRRGSAISASQTQSLQPITGRCFEVVRSKQCSASSVQSK